MQTFSAAQSVQPVVAQWIVQPHGDLEKIDEGIWSVSGLIHIPIGQFPRRMTVVQLEGGRLLLYSAIALDEATLEHVEKLGRPALLVVPNDHHREDALAWKQRFPEMLVIAPPGSRERVEAEVPVDTTAAGLADGEVRLVVVPGTREHEMALVIRRSSGTTLVVNDVISNVRSTHGFTGWMLRRMGFAGDSPSVPGPIRLLLVKEKELLAVQLRQWAQIPDLARIVVSHGDVIETDPAGALQALADSLR